MKSTKKTAWFDSQYNNMVQHIIMNNLLFKNCLKHVHHSDLFIALFDLNSLYLHYTCQNGVYKN